MEEYESLVKGIILTESKGKGIDLMQSSESAYGKANLIDNQKESIDQGVSYLAEMINEAKKQGCDLDTAIQAYNFGKDYIVYVKNRGGENTMEIAEEYSKNVLSPLLGNEKKPSIAIGESPHCFTMAVIFIIMEGTCFTQKLSR